MLRSCDNGCDIHAVVRVELIRRAALAELIMDANESLDGGRFMRERLRDRTPEAAVVLVFFERDDGARLTGDRYDRLRIERFNACDIQHNAADPFFFECACREERLMYERPCRQERN